MLPSTGVGCYDTFRININGWQTSSTETLFYEISYIDGDEEVFLTGGEWLGNHFDTKLPVGSAPLFNRIIVVYVKGSTTTRIQTTVTVLPAALPVDLLPFIEPNLHYNNFMALNMILTCVSQEEISISIAEYITESIQLSMQIYCSNDTYSSQVKVMKRVLYQHPEVYKHILMTLSSNIACISSAYQDTFEIISTILDETSNIQWLVESLLNARSETAVCGEILPNIITSNVAVSSQIDFTSKFQSSGILFGIEEYSSYFKVPASSFSTSVAKCLVGNFVYYNKNIHMNSNQRYVLNNYLLSY